jgi:uncharacterized protein (TIGR03663 family)
MESGNYRFDPLHYHGPLLSSLAIPIARVCGEPTWQDLSKQTLRLLPALAGTFLVLVPLLGRRRFGDASMLLTAALLATSPLLVYYSQMFIHEMLLALFGMASLFFLTKKPGHVLPGLLVGLMFATKESFAISMLAWSGAALLIAWEHRQNITREASLSFWKNSRAAIFSSVSVAIGVSLYSYTDGFRQPAGALDAVRTFFVYETVVGHDKPFAYYLSLLALPDKSAGLWWFGTPVVILAIIAFISTFRDEPAHGTSRTVLRFVAYSAIGHFLIYSIFRYKTPWLACLPWAHVCLLAGFAVTRFYHRSWITQCALGLLVATTLGTQFQQSRNATGRFAADERNPFAYVPTRRDVEGLEDWLAKLKSMNGGTQLEPLAVIGSDYWPLPWYLRSFEKIGYWATPPEGLAGMPLVFAMPETAAATEEILAKTHACLPRGLRSNVPLQVFVRNDLWERWMNP